MAEPFGVDITVYELCHYYILEFSVVTSAQQSSSAHQIT